MGFSVDSKMYPRKSILDYKSEMNRYPRTEGESGTDMFQSPLPRTSSFNQYTMAQSSSSTDTSPDSFPDLTPHQFPPEFRPEGARKPDLYPRNSQWSHEQDNQFRPESYDSFRAAFESRRPDVYFEGHSRTFNQMHPETGYRSHHPDLNNLVLAEHIYESSPVRRQRPIIGRKIMAPAEAPRQTVNEFPIWHPDTQQTPPKSLEQKYTPNMYELFPSENRGFEFPSPVKTPHASPQLGPSRFSQSPRTSTPSLTPPPRALFSPRMTPFKEPLVGPNVNSYGASKMCTFCRKNGETPYVYNTHTVKEKVGNKNVVMCPILRSHVCSTCGVSGDDAHTITYCPVLRSGNNGQPLQSTTITLKNTRVKSNGRRRY